MSIDEQLNMERQYRDQESTQARYASRLKSACCRRCGSADGMKSIHRDELRRFITPLSAAVIEILTGLYSTPDSDEHLFYPCHRCNRDRVIPVGFVLLSLLDVLYWIGPNIDPMASGYDALAAEAEQALASQDSRESAGMEG